LERTIDAATAGYDVARAVGIARLIWYEGADGVILGDMSCWMPEVELPRGLDELHGPTTGVVYLLMRVAPNAPFPELVE
jgi:hypothetical protein